MRSASKYYSGFDEERYKHHFLDSCFLCQRQIGQNSDIYMYRGNTPFCSQECRQEQIEIDEANDRKKLKFSSSSKRSSSNTVMGKNKESGKNESGKNTAVRTGVVAVA